MNIEHATVHSHATALHSHSHGPVRLQRPDTSLNIQLCHASAFLLRASVSVHLRFDLARQSTEWGEPDVENATHCAVSKRGLDHVAASVAAEDDVLDLEVDDGVLDYGEGVEVGGGDDVGNISVDEDVTRLKTENGGFRDTSVGAAKPDCSDGQHRETQCSSTKSLTNRRCVLLGNRLEKGRILTRLVACPSLVGAQGIGVVVLWLMLVKFERLRTLESYRKPL